MGFFGGVAEWADATTPSVELPSHECPCCELNVYDEDFREMGSDEPVCKHCFDALQSDE